MAGHFGALAAPPSNFVNRVSIAHPSETIGRGRARFIYSLPHELLGCFLRSYETSQALERVPVYAVAELGPILRPDRAVDVAPLIRFPLGLLGTDHVGYCSFDLTVLRDATVVDRLSQIVESMGALQPPEGAPADQKPTIGLTRLLVYPFADPLLAVDALSAGDLGPNLIALRIELDAADLDGRSYGRAVAAMQNPSIVDWRLSPGSFSLAGALLVGEDGCETLLPANLSTQQFRFRQLARVAAEPLEERGRIRLGHVFDYATEWFSIGHSLGQVLYSLPLAPGEKIRLAIVDWSRQDRATRDEETSLAERLVHDWTHDRNLSETAQAVLQEWQRGGSLMGGIGGAAGAKAGPVGLGATLALGGAYTTSSGTRDLTAQTTQRISESFHQASTALRELRSTVVVQSEQAEQADVKTRIVANYNHSHALTLLYYEVLRHYRVVTRLTSERPVLLVSYEDRLPLFGVDETILAHRQTLEAVLLDERLRPSFDVLEKLACARLTFKEAAPGGPTDDFELGEIMFKVKTGATAPSFWVQVNLAPKEGEPFPCLVVNPNPPPLPGPSDYLMHWLTVPSERRVEADRWDTFRLRPTKRVRWGNVARFDVGHIFAPSSTTTAAPQDWAIERFAISTNDEARFWPMVFGPPPAPVIKPHSWMGLPVARYVPPPRTAEETLTAEEHCSIDRLRRHLTGSFGHYARAIWLAENEDERATRFEGRTVGGQPLLDLIENRIVEVVGRWVAFPVNRGAERVALSLFERDPQDESMPGDDFVEQLLTLPTRGVFAEAKLGHCNASEVIDSTRFWDWQTSPIPDSAPEITGVTPGSRAESPQGRAPTAFPSGLVNIVSPPGLPDPTGLSGALNLFGALGGFRDMSAAREVGALLQTLSNNASGLASQGLKGAQTQQLIDQIRGSKELSRDQKDKLVRDLIGGQVSQAVGGFQAQGQGQAQAQAQAQGQAQGQVAQGQGTGTGVGQAAATGGAAAGGEGGSGGAAQATVGQMSQTATGGTGVGQSTVQVGGQPAPKPQPKPPLTQRINPANVRLILIFEGFSVAGAIRTVWGPISQIGGAADGLPPGPPYAGKVDYLCRHVNGEGTIHLYVQLDVPDNTSLNDVAHFKPAPTTKWAVIHVRPKTAEVEVKTKRKLDAKLKAEAAFKTQHGGEIPVRMLLVKIEDSLGVNVGLDVELGQETEYKFTYLVLRPGLQMSGDVVH